MLATPEHHPAQGTGRSTAVIADTLKLSLTRIGLSILYAAHGCRTVETQGMRTRYGHCIPPSWVSVH